MALTPWAHDGELSPVGKLGVVLVVVFAAATALYHLANGTVVRPRAFWIVVAGFGCFLVAKLSVIAQGRRVSFGTAHISENLANFYRSATG